MDLFPLVKRNVFQDNFDLVNFLEVQSTCTPVRDQFSVAMKEFNVDHLRNCIIYNLFRQGLHLRPETCRQVIKFLDDDFTELTKRVYIQVFVDFAKMNIRKMYETYSVNFEGNPSGEKQSLDAYFDYEIATFVEQALLQPSFPSEIVGVISQEKKQMILSAMLTVPVISALDQCLNLLNCSCSPDWIKKEIEEMQIYFVDDFNPATNLRGACLVDGILICTNGLEGTEGTHKREADFITIATHESAHYLERMKYNNFNFSSPFDHQHEARHDLVDPKLNLELGRTVELLLFDNIQPDWRSSLNTAAKTFLDRLNVYKECPVIKESERRNLGLRARFQPSLSFGIDLKQSRIFFC